MVAKAAAAATGTTATRGTTVKAATKKLPSKLKLQATAAKPKPKPKPKKRPAPKLTKKTPPSLTVEKAMWAQGFDVIVGLDEVGRGSWAGPLAIGAAVLPRTGRVNGVRDSKMLSEREREALFDKLTTWCAAWSIGMVSHDECDEIGMSAAQKLAARRAIEGLGVVPDRVLVDGNWDFVGEYVGVEKVTKIVKGDAKCLSIATASVLAKVSRDRLMREEDVNFPGFNFAENKGYPCPKHQIALRGYGPTTIHRRSWVFMEHQPWSIPRMVPASAQQSLF
jgi:ribonuclease HII